MQKTKLLLTVILLLALFGLLYKALIYSRPNELNSALVGSPVPHFDLPDLLDPQVHLTEQDLKGRVVLLNVWATWCQACQSEHAMLMELKEIYHLPIYSINYKDSPDAALQWLANQGNPYLLTGQDRQGNVGIDLGVYGTPETFIIDAQGNIVYRHVGAINLKNWQDTLYPIIQKLTGRV